MAGKRWSIIVLAILLAACRDGGSSSDGDADVDSDADGDRDGSDIDGDHPDFDGDLDPDGDAPGDGPIILLFNADMDRLTAGETVSFFAMVTHPDGVANVVGGRLTTPAGLAYAGFVAEGEGSYRLSISWADINRVESIEFTEPQTREFVAVFTDASGHESSESLTIELDCGGLAACEGACVDINTSTVHCGACRVSCDPSEECHEGTCAPPCGDGICQEGEDGSICPADCCTAGTYSGDMTVAGAGDLATLRGYRTITGLLRINTSDLTDLSGLECLTEVGGSLDVSGNTSLMSLHGMHSLQRVGASFQVSGNPLLRDFLGVPALTTIGTAFLVHDNATLESFDGLEALTSAGSTLRIRLNPSLGSIEAISDVACVDFLAIEENDSLPNCEAEALRDRMFADGCAPTATIRDNSSAPCE